MIISARGRYAVMAMADMAASKSIDPVSLNDIAIRQNISLNYLEQIFVKLRSYNLVKSFRGPGGGYILVSDPSEISIYDIISAVGESVKMTKCGDENFSCNNGDGKCITHFLWEGMDTQIANYLSATKLSEVAKLSSHIGC
jgi:Rrf2 family transcriptional regulator, iron-sulfur cluster assembly transcription factor